MTRTLVRYTPPGGDGSTEDGHRNTCGPAAPGAPSTASGAVRFGLERSYRAPTRPTPDQARRIELIDLANAIQPRTLT